MPALLIPNSNSEDAAPFVLPHRRGIMLKEENTCHNPGGTPAGGRFCSKTMAGSAAVGMAAHFKARGLDPNSPPEGWYPKARRASELAERDLEVALAAEGIRRDPKALPVEKAYAGLIAKRDLEARAALSGTDDSWQRHLGPDGKLTDARREFHQKVIETFVADMQRERGAPISRGVANPQVIFVGGISGAGKSTAVGQTMKAPDALVCDGDVFKAYLKKMDPALRNAEAADLQRESAHLSDLLARYGAANRMNVLVDGTIKTLGDEGLRMDDHLAGRLKAFKELGYHTEVRFVDITVDQSVHRVLHRFLSEVEDGKEGRFVAPSFVRQAQSDAEYGTKPRRSFFGVRDRKDLVDGWVAIDGWTGRELGRRGVLISQFAGR